jgi:Domain of unknown function (DUF1707)
MDDRIRISDADRERVTARLREHYAEGRLTSDELEERVTAALNAKTNGDLRRIMVDLPEPAPVGPQSTPPPWARQPTFIFRRGPRLLPLALFVLLAAIVLPGAGWFVVAAVFKVILLFWLVTCIAGIFAAARFRRRMRRNWSSYADQWQNQWQQWQWRR